MLFTAAQKKPKVLLIQPPIYDFALYDLYFKPYGLLRIAAWFEARGYDIDVLNMLDWQDTATEQALGSVKRKADGTGKFFKQFVQFPREMLPFRRFFHRYGVLKEEAERRISVAAPDVIAITSGMTYWYKGVEEVLLMAERLAPNALVLLGGVYATLMPEHAAGLGRIDAIARGSDITPMVELLQRRGLPVTAQNGAAEGKRAAFGSAASAQNRESCAANSAHTHVPLDPMMLEGVWNDAAVLRLNEGCPLSCDYCASNILCPRFHAGNPERAFRWVEKLVCRFGTTRFAFYDDALLVNKEHVFIPFLQQLLERPDISSGLSWYTPNAMHIRYLDQGTAELMYRAGFQEVRMGFESSSETFHANHDRKFSLTSFHDAVGMLKRAGFASEQLLVYVLAGLPGQYAEEVEESIRYAAEVGVRISVAEYSPVPQTPMWEESCRISRLPLAEEPLYHNNTYQPMAWDGFTREDMDRLKRLSRELF